VTADKTNERASVRGNRLWPKPTWCVRVAFQTDQRAVSSRSCPPPGFWNGLNATWLFSPAIGLPRSALLQQRNAEPDRVPRRTPLASCFHEQVKLTRWHPAMISFNVHARHRQTSANNRGETARIWAKGTNRKREQKRPETWAAPARPTSPRPMPQPLSQCQGGLSPSPSRITVTERKNSLDPATYKVTSTPACRAIHRPKRSTMPDACAMQKTRNDGKDKERKTYTDDRAPTTGQKGVATVDASTNTRRDETSRD